MIAGCAPYPMHAMRGQNRKTRPLKHGQSSSDTCIVAHPPQRRNQERNHFPRVPTQFRCAATPQSIPCFPFSFPSSILRLCVPIYPKALPPLYNQQVCLAPFSYFICVCVYIFIFGFSCLPMLLLFFAAFTPPSPPITPPIFFFVNLNSCHIYIFFTPIALRFSRALPILFHIR